MGILLLIFILAIIQSLFGVGILLFGTPILLMAGLEYQEALLYLLPASMALSWSQVRELRHQKLDGGYRKRFLLLCIPALIIGMILTGQFDLKFEIRVFVTIMLLTAFVLRSSEEMRIWLQGMMKRQLNLALVVMGLVHGLSNMGGSLLTPIVSSLYQSKKKVLAGVSFDYAFMATSQLIILTIIQGHVLTSKHLLVASIALVVRWTLGRRVFRFTQDDIYQKLLNGLIFANAIVLVLSFR